MNTAMHSTRQLLQRRVIIRCTLLGAILFIAFCLAMMLGDYPVAPADLLASLLSPLTGQRNPGIDFIVLNVRLPRAILAILSGAAFALSGAIFQALLRNPLASPDIIGISQGASAAAVFCIIILNWSGLLLGFGALGGALATALAIYLLAWRDGVSPYRVVLIGIAVAAILSAVISYLFTRARISEVQQALGWLVGSLNAANYSQLWPLAAALCLLVPMGIFLARPLKALELGDDMARALGTRVELAHLGLIVVAVALSAFATAAAGPVAFVAFMSAPITKRIMGTGRHHFGAVMLVGAALMTAADLLAQHALPEMQLPVGVVTGLLGAIFLLWLLVTASRTGRI